ncbi:ArsR/SmtB family transcription factor [Streptomyces sp. NPDC087305]|uniref:ArsR/SmtB family transcription factor n=1 Tax=Streptomyces sp. NPDC087305 TaxID=3365781 RepID=UPI00381BC41A
MSRACSQEPSLLRTAAARLWTEESRAWSSSRRQRVADGGSTSELARCAGILVSSASQHLTVLRRAGVVVSRREANVVVHAVTPLGTDLLRGRQSSPKQVCSDQQ